MRSIAWTLLAFAVLVPAVAGQAPLLHYTFNEGGVPAATENIGTFSPGLSALTGHILVATSPNRTNCLTGITGAANQLATPFNINLGNTSWTIGFALDSSASPGFQYIFSDDTVGGWRAFTDGAAGVGNVRITGGTVPTIDIIGGAGNGGFVHVAWVHDTAANQIRAYLNGVLFSTTAAAAVNLNSGLQMIIGRNGIQSLLNGNRVEEFRLYDYALSTTQVAAWADNALNGVADFSKVMISEVSWGNPDGLEITNYGTGTVNMTNWRVRWRDGAGTFTSDPLNVSIPAGQSVVVIEDVGALEAVPTGTQVIDRFPVNIPTIGSAATVALCDEIGNDLDEVRISDTAGLHPGWSFGSAFRGLALRTVATQNGAQVGVERLWGLDSNGGTDWTEQGNRSFGRENRSSGARGTDPSVVLDIRINEVDDNADYIELFNATAGAHNLSGWFILCSAGQNGSHIVNTLPAGSTIAANGFMVIGDAATQPVEIPGGVPYLDLTSIPWGTGEFDCALYDNLGRLVDLVRTTRVNTQLVHNNVRAPSHWADFIGAGVKTANGGDDALGRSSSGLDNNSGADWFPIFTRTMGSANLSTSVSGPAGHGDAFDVRLNETSIGQGFQVIMNAGAPAANHTYNFLVSVGHSTGSGIFFGLGADALANLPAFFNVPPFSGLLDGQGSGRIDFDPGILPAGVDADFIFVLQAPNGALVARTLVLAFDT